MGAMDKFWNFMKNEPGSDEDEDDEYVPEMDDEDDEPRGRRRNSGYDKRGSRFEDDDDEVSARSGAFRRGQETSSASSRSQASRSAASVKVNPLVDPGQEVRVFKPTNLDEARKVTDTLLNKQSAVLNLEGLDLLMAQRIIDFVGGSNYAIRGHFTRISNFIFLFTPSDVDIAGDITEGADAADMQSDPGAGMNSGIQFGQN